VCDLFNEGRDVANENEQADSVRAADGSTADPLNPLQLTSDGRLAYVITSRHWAVYADGDVKKTCPNGLNGGPREQFEQRFPSNGTRRTLLDTQLMREGDQWFPSAEPDGFTFREVSSKVSYGMNLDGQATRDDFVNPEGEAGVDNQLYRAIGCIAGYRPPNGPHRESESQNVPRYNYNRFVIEIIGVDNLANDDAVIVKSYRGLDPLMTDAGGSAYITGTTQRIDERWGAFAESTWKGRIVDGVLVTEPADVEMPAALSFGTTANHTLKDYRFRLTLTPEHAKGIMAGYVDVDQFIRHLNVSTATAIASYGQLSSPSLYRAMRRLADGHPDSESGQNTSISSALEVEFVRVFLAPRSTDQVADSRSKQTASR
jgi:hypothetical protein